jgi:hypothetical protein
MVAVAYLHERLRQLDESYDHTSLTAILGPAGHFHGQVQFLRKKSQAIALGNLTLAFIRQGKVGEAADTMHRTIDAVELTRGGGGLNLAFSAGRELRPWRGEAWAQDINDRLLALMAAI